MDTVTVRLPCGALHTIGVPVHPQLQRQINTGVLTVVADDPAEFPPDGSDGEGDAGRVPASTAPKGNASRDDWAVYAVAQGMSEVEAAALSRDELKARLVDGEG